MIDTQNPLVFVSYSHGDYKWRDALKLHLDSLFWTKSHMRLFVDSGMVSGAEYERDITAALAHTTVGVLIVSPSFLRSPFIQRKELPLMLKRQRDNLMDIVPIIVEPCVWDEREDLRQFLAPLDGTPLSTLPQREQKKMLLEIARQINQRYRERLDVSQKITVVIADDRDYEVRGIGQLFQEGLANDLAVIGTCRTPNEVEQVVLEAKPDVLLLDLSWFRNDEVGLQLIGNLQRLSTTTRIIALSNYPDLLEKAQRKGVTTLDKGFSILQLFNTIREVALRDETQIQVKRSFETVTNRELEVLRAAAEGASTKMIATQLTVSDSTVKAHLRNIYRKTGAKSRTEAVLKAREAGIL